MAEKSSNMSIEVHCIDLKDGCRILLYCSIKVRALINFRACDNRLISRSCKGETFYLIFRNEMDFYLTTNKRMKCCYTRPYLKMIVYSPHERIHFFMQALMKFILTWLSFQSLLFPGAILLFEVVIVCFFCIFLSCTLNLKWEMGNKSITSWRLETLLNIVL